jgi:hypothetical protein
MTIRTEVVPRNPLCPILLVRPQPGVRCNSVFNFEQSKICMQLERGGFVKQVRTFRANIGHAPDAQPSILGMGAL